MALAFTVPVVAAGSGRAFLAHAQQEKMLDREPLAEAPPQQAPLAIPAAEIAARAEEASARLQELRRRLAPDPSVAGIEMQLPETIRELRRLARDPQNQIAPEASLRALDDIESRWVQFKDQLAGWERVVMRRAEALEGTIGVVTELRERWQQTGNSAKDENFPPALVDRVRSTLAAIVDTEKQVRDRRDAILTLQNQVSQEQVAIAGLLAKVRAARADLRRRLFVIDSPPIWRVLLEPSPAKQSLGRQIVHSWAKNTDALGDFLRGYPERLALQMLLFVAAVAFFHQLRLRAHAWALWDETLEPSARILARPLSAALLITCLITPWLYPAAPKVIFSLTGVLVVLPVLRLLPGVLLTNLRSPLFALTTFYVIDQFRDLAPELSLLHRLLLLGETVLACAGLLWMLGLARRAQDPRRLGWPRAVRLGARLALPILAASVVGNLLGTVSLSHVLTSAALKSAYAAVALYAGALILDGVVVVALRAPPAQSLRVIRDHSVVLRERGTTAVHATMIILWVVATLEMAAIREPLFASMWSVLTATWTFGSVRVSLGDLLGFGLAIWLAFLASRLVRFVLEEEVFPHLSLPRGMPNTISSTVHYTVLLLGFLVAVAVAGVDLGRFALLVGAFGVGIGFGLQNIVNNFVSGLILLFERPIQIGDTIEIGSLSGEVRRIGIRSSTVRTWEGAEVIVPNGNLISDQVVNWTLSDRHRRIELPVGVCYGTDPERVIDILLEVARAHPETLDEPPPTALFQGFGESSLDFSLRVWTPHFETWVTVRSDLNVAVYTRLRSAGIEIPFPQRDLHLRSVDPSVYGTIGKEKDT